MTLLDGNFLPSSRSVISMPFGTLPQPVHATDPEPLDVQTSQPVYRNAAEELHL